MRRRLIVTADDFGMSPEVNEAVEEAHRNGVLTGASLLMAGAVAEDAISRARRMPELGVGLHLALYGAPAMSRLETIPDLLDPSGAALGERPMITGARMALSPRIRAQVRREIVEQFEAFRRSGLLLDHVDGHWHCHQHPDVLRTVLEVGVSYGMRAIRIPYEPALASWRGAGRVDLGLRSRQAVAHWPLAAGMRLRMTRKGLAGNDWFFGKVDGGDIDLHRMSAMIRALPSGVSEFGLHPATAPWSGRHAPPSAWRVRAEFEALIDPRLRRTLAQEGVELIRFGDLEPARAWRS